MTTPTTPAAAVSLPLAAEIWTCQGEIDACRDDGMLGAFDTDHTQGNAHFDIGYVRLDAATARESALVAERDALRAALDNKAAILDEIREVIGWEDASPVTTIKRLFAERDQLRAELNKCKVALVTSIRTSQ